MRILVRVYLRNNKDVSKRSLSLRFDADFSFTISLKLDFKNMLTSKMKTRLTLNRGLALIGFRTTGPRAAAPRSAAKGRNQGL